MHALLCWPDVLLLCAPAQNHQPTAMQSRGHSPGRVQPAAAGFTPWPGPVTLLKRPKHTAVGTDKLSPLPELNLQQVHANGHGLKPSTGAN